MQVFTAVTLLFLECTSVKGLKYLKYTQLFHIFSFYCARIPQCNSHYSVSTFLIQSVDFFQVQEFFHIFQNFQMHTEYIISSVPQMLMASSWTGSRSCQPQLWKDKDTWLIASVTRCGMIFPPLWAAQQIVACSGTAQAWLKKTQNTTGMITVHLFKYPQVSIDALKCQFV